MKKYTCKTCGSNLILSINQIKIYTIDPLTGEKLDDLKIVVYGKSVICKKDESHFTGWDYCDDGKLIEITKEGAIDEVLRGRT